MTKSIIMKATDPFKRTIQANLEQYAKTDELFAESNQLKHCVYTNEYFSKKKLSNSISENRR